MITTIQTYMSRHRKKFLVTGVLIGGFYMCYRYIRNKVMFLNGLMTKQIMDRERHSQFSKSSENICNQVIYKLSSELSHVIARELDMDKLLEQLRQNPPNKVEIWEELKIIAFTRLATIIYATSMLVTTLRVQIYLLGGYLYRDTRNGESYVSEKIKEQYLSIISSFIHNGGINQLINHLRSRISPVIKSFPLNKSLTMSHIEQIFWSIEKALNNSPNEPSISIAKYVFPQHILEYCSYTKILQQLLIDTLNLIEGSAVLHTYSTNICEGVALAVNMIELSLKDTIAESQVKYNNVEAIPMAKLIPVIARLTAHSEGSYDPPRGLIYSYTNYLVYSEKNKKIGADIHEEFFSFE